MNERRQPVLVGQPKVPVRGEYLCPPSGWVIFDAIAELMNSRDDRQDKHLRERIDDLREDLQTLVAQAE